MAKLSTLGCESEVVTHIKECIFKKSWSFKANERVLSVRFSGLRRWGRTRYLFCSVLENILIYFYCKFLGFN